MSVKWNRYVKFCWFFCPFHEGKKRNPWMFYLIYHFSSWDCLITQLYFTRVSIWHMNVGKANYTSHDFPSIIYRLGYNKDVRKDSME